MHVLGRTSIGLGVLLALGVSLPARATGALKTIGTMGKAVHPFTQGGGLRLTLRCGEQLGPQALTPKTQTWTAPPTSYTTDVWTYEWPPDRGLVRPLAAAEEEEQEEASAAAPGTAHPNILILLADDLGWGDVGYHGGVARTPNLDRLAADGVRLENFHSCPLCSPTRAGLMTGRWPIRYGMMKSVITPWRQYGLPPTERTFADLVARAGYTRRGAFGKWHLGHYRPELLPRSRGFTHFVGCYNGNMDYFTHHREGQLDWHRNETPCRDAGYATDLIAQEAARFIAESPPDRPFLAYVAFTAPHLPLQAKDEDIAKYAHLPDPKQRIYTAMIDCLDQGIGRILRALEAQGRADNTCVLFLSDNGATSRGDNGPWRGTKGTTYEGGIRVPAVIRWPAGGLRGGRAVETLMGYIDVVPTIRRLAGVTDPAPNPLDGRDLIDLIATAPSAPPRLWYSYVAQGPERSAVCDGTWKLVATRGSVLELADPNAPPPPELELFHLGRDPGEQSDLRTSHPAAFRRLLAQLQGFRRLKLEGLPDWKDGREDFHAPLDWTLAPCPPEGGNAVFHPVPLCRVVLPPPAGGGVTPSGRERRPGRRHHAG